MSLEGVAETLGVESFTWKGTSYQIPRANFTTEAAYRKYLEADDYKRIQVHQATVSPQDYRELLSGWRKDCNIGIWAYGMPDAMRAMQNPEHFSEFVWLCLTQVTEQRSLLRQQVGEMLKDQAMQAEIIGKVNGLMAQNPTTPRAEPAAGSH